MNKFYLFNNGVYLPDPHNKKREQVGVDQLLSDIATEYKAIHHMVKQRGPALIVDDNTPMTEIQDFVPDKNKLSVFLKAYFNKE